MEGGGRRRGLEGRGVLGGIKGGGRRDQPAKVGD
jgi:hypothetical protein